MASTTTDAPAAVPAENNTDLPFHARYRRLIGLAMVVLFFLLWEASVHVFQVSRFVLSPPSRVFAAWIDLAQRDFFWAHFRYTVSEILIGFSLAIVIGVTLGVILGRSRLAEAMFSPFIVASQVIPKVGLMPLFLLWFGFGMQSKIAMVTLLSFFPILKATMLGVTSIEQMKRDLFQVYRATPWQRIRHLEIPAVLPYIMTGIETASVLAVTGAIVGEYLGGNQGLGAFIVITLSQLQVDRMFATILTLAVFGFVFYSSIAMIRRWAVSWHESVRLAK